MPTKIQWTNETDNVFVVKGKDGKQNGWYCYKVSPGCEHCYAEHLNVSGIFGGNGLPYRIPMNGVFPEFLPRTDIMDKWKNKTKRRMHFINSMTDTFGSFIPEEWIYILFDKMAGAPLQTFQVLTKRADRMYEIVHNWLYNRSLTEVPHHIRLGVSVENQLYADKRIGKLCGIPCQRFVSVEPMLGRVDLSPWINYLHWVILGGESGDKARPLHPIPVQAVRDLCVVHKVPFHFKQWGSWIAKSQIATLTNGVWEIEPAWKEIVAKAKTWGILNADGVFLPQTTTWNGRQNDPNSNYEVIVYEVGKKEAGRLLDGQEWNEDPDGLQGNLADADRQAS